MISASQCRAARALLNWSQPELAGRCAFNVQTISNFEMDNGSPTKTTIQKIIHVFENAGIVFTKEGGVNPNVSEIAVYKGRDGFRSFMDDVYETAKKYGGDIYLFNSRPKLWYEWLGEEWYEMHSERMKALGKNIDVRITVQEGDDFLILKTAKHKWFPKFKKLSKDKIFYAYGPKLAFLDFSENDLKISVLNKQEFSDIFRILYDIAWDNVAKDIPDTK